MKSQDQVIAFSFMLIVFLITTMIGISSGHPQVLWIWATLIFVDFGD